MARYKYAIQWMADNDDNEWVDGDPDSAAGMLSVTASLTADLFEKTDEQVRSDLKAALTKLTRERQDRKTRLIPSPDQLP